MFRNFKDLGGLWLLHDVINCTVRDELGMSKDSHNERARLSSVASDSSRFFCTWKLLACIPCPSSTNQIRTLVISQQLHMDHGQHLRVDKSVSPSIFVVRNSFTIAGCQNSETEIAERDLVGKRSIS